MSDFDWIEQHDINPWLEYDAILFDIEPTEEDANKYINMALQTLEFGNKGAWEASLSSDSEYLINLFREWGSSYIRITEFDNLLQGYNPSYLIDNNVIKYSELVGNQLTESEDELDWIREITPWVPFQQAEIDKLYGIKKNDLLLQVLRDCESGQRIYYDSVSVEVLDKDELRHKDVHCGSGNEDMVLTLNLRFYGQDTKSLGVFWVTEDMVTLHQLYDNLTESDEWEWAREIPTIDLSEGVYYIDLEGLTPNERCDVQQALLDVGCSWLNGNNLKSFNYEYIAYTVYNGILYTSVTDYKTWSRREIDHNYIGGKSLLNNKINESEDEWEWAREIPDSIPFNELENDKKYKYVPNQNFYGAVKSCGMGDRISDWITYVKVMITLYDESEKIPYNDIYCHHKRQDRVSHVVLRIYDDEGNNIRFAVTEDMGEFYPLSEKTLKDLLKLDLNESEDELNWIRETPLNPWYDYDSIDFDIEPTDEDVNHYIELALQTREISNRGAWGSGRKFDIISIKDYARDGDCQLVINQWGEMTYGPKRFVETNKRIKYSELKQNTITESEDGLEWIRDINPMVPKIGSRYVMSTNDLNDFLAQVELEHGDSVTWSSGDKPTKWSPDVFGQWISVVLRPNKDNSGGSLKFSWVIDINELPKGTIEWPHPGIINESEDDGLEWIREVDPRPRIELGRSYDVHNDYVWEFLETAELSNINIRWSTGRQPTEFYPELDHRRGSTVINIDIHPRVDGQGLLTYWSNYGDRDTTHLIEWPHPRTINESEDLDWIINTNPEDIDTISFFQEGKCYYMGKLINKDLGCIKFEKYDPKDTAHSYEDGRGILQFGTYWYSPKFIEEMLKEKNITLYDLETKENISNLMESEDLDWIINTEIPIQPGTMYRSSDEQTLREILQLIEDKFPKAKWMSGVKPTKFFPSLDDYAGRRRTPTIVFQDDYMMYFFVDDSLLDGDELNYQLIEL
jgi:hypothetical protein